MHQESSARTDTHASHRHRPPSSTFGNRRFTHGRHDRMCSFLYFCLCRFRCAYGFHAALRFAGTRTSDRPGTQNRHSFKTFIQSSCCRQRVKISRHLKRKIKYNLCSIHNYSSEKCSRECKIICEPNFCRSVNSPTISTWFTAQLRRKSLWMKSSIHWIKFSCEIKRKQEKEIAPPNHNTLPTLIASLCISFREKSARNFVGWSCA